MKANVNKKVITTYETSYTSDDGRIFSDQHSCQVWEDYYGKTLFDVFTKYIVGDEEFTEGLKNNKLIDGKYFVVIDTIPNDNLLYAGLLLNLRLPLGLKTKLSLWKVGENNNLHANSYFAGIDTTLPDLVFNITEDILEVNETLNAFSIITSLAPEIVQDMNLNEMETKDSFIKAIKELNSNLKKFGWLEE